MSVSTPALDGAPAMGGLFLALRRGAPRVAIYPGDGIGVDVTDATLRSLQYRDVVRGHRQPIPPRHRGGSAEAGARLRGTFGVLQGVVVIF